MAYPFKRFLYEVTLDADEHILEPPALCEMYPEEKYQPRAFRIQVDDAGYEYLEIDGQPSKRAQKGSLGFLGAMDEGIKRPSPDRRDADNVRFGASQAADPLSQVQQENLAYCLLYPTFVRLWEVDVTDPERSLAGISG